jgi:cellulose synthase/poly-beta-1,6-N-acetylglucosamine synthase-like glycosyltransferase
MTPPGVSVVMGVFQARPSYLRAAVQSVLSQTYQTFELIIIEDPSPQPAASVLREFSDSRIRLSVRDEKGGFTSALRYGMELAKAPLIARLDADDLCQPQRLATQVRYLQEHPDVAVVGSRISVINDQGDMIGRRLLPLTHDQIAAALRRYNCISHPSVMFRRDAVEAIGGYDPNAQIEDYDLWCRMLNAGYRFANIPEDLIGYRFHFESIRSTQVRRTIRATIAIKKRYFRGRFTMRDRMRIVLERSLLLLPARLTLWLFRKTQYSAA